jgi:transposase-like protein
MSRWRGEVMGLELEAERLVRSGESRAEVSRRLGVHPQTLATWALRGRWRKKDLELERAEDIRRETILTIRAGNATMDDQNVKRAKLATTMQEAVRLLAAGDAASLAKLEAMIGGGEPVKLLAAPEKVSLGPDPTMGSWRSVGAWDTESEPEPSLTEDGEAWTPEVQKKADATKRARMIRRGKMAATPAPGREKD